MKTEMKRWRIIGWIVVLSLFGLTGCGFFKSPYDIKKAPPPAGVSVSDLLPTKNAENVGVPPPGFEDFAEAALDVAGRSYAGEVSLVIARFPTGEAAHEFLSEAYEKAEAGRKTKVTVKDYGWTELRGGDGYWFAWTNHEWLFRVHAPTREAAEPVMLATGYLEKEKKGRR